MITKGIIQSINKLDDSVDFDIRLPIFETAGADEPFIETGKLCYQPGNLEGYLVGDVVFVTFENNKIEKPIILGKLYRGNEKSLFLDSLKTTEYNENDMARKNSTNFSYSGDLEVTNSAVLPKNTVIGEDISYGTLIQALYDIADLQRRVTDLENE